MVQAGQVVIEYGDLAQGLSLSAILSLPLLNILLTRGKRTIAFDDTDSFEETCGYLATADRRHFVIPFMQNQRQRQLPAVMRQVNEVTVAQLLKTKFFASQSTMRCVPFCLLQLRETSPWVACQVSAS